jgi:hypothetical protein
MKLNEWREEFPEYDHLSDDEVIAEYDIEVGELPDLSTPILYEIEEKLEALCAAVASIQIPDMTDVVKQIKNQLKVLETAIKGIDVNVTLPAPIVNIPQQPPIKIPAIVIPPVVLPEPMKEWKFSIVRDRNGFVSEIIAKGI